MKVYTLREAAEVLQMDRHQVGAELRAGRLKGRDIARSKTPQGRRWRISEAALRAYLNQ